MSDCRVPEPRGYDVARLRIEFEGEEIPWMYPLALNGRSIQGVFVDGERYERVRECNVIKLFSARFPHEFGNEVVELSCGHLTSRHDSFCPKCGARVRGGGDD